LSKFCGGDFDWKIRKQGGKWVNCILWRCCCSRTQVSFFKWDQDSCQNY